RHAAFDRRRGNLRRDRPQTRYSAADRARRINVTNAHKKRGFLRPAFFVFCCNLSAYISSPLAFLTAGACCLLPFAGVRFLLNVSVILTEKRQPRALTPSGARPPGRGPAVLRLFLSNR